jgi:hypothetical protein
MLIHSYDKRMIFPAPHNTSKFGVEIDSIENLLQIALILKYSDWS